MDSNSNILIISYYYPPCNYVAANRPEYFARMLAQAGYNIDVVTRQWEGNEKTWTDYIDSSEERQYVLKQISDNLSIHYIPYTGYKYAKNIIVSKINVLGNYIKGNFHFELDSTQLLEHCYQLLNKKKYSYILVSSPPLNVIGTASRLSREFDIPLIVDFRDFQNHITLGRNQKLSAIEKIEHFFVMRILKKWLFHAKILFSVTPLITKYLEKNFREDVFTLMNGFDEELLSLEPIENRDEFVLSFIGTLYPYADVEVLYGGLKMLFNNHPNILIKINLIGVTMEPIVADSLIKIIPPKNIFMTDRLPKSQAINIALKSHILFLVGFTDWQGVLPTKFFEYLGLRKNILQVPGDDGIIEDAIKKLRVGKTPHTSEEMCTCILEWYKEWNETKTIAYNGEIFDIQKFSREQQFSILLEKLNKLS